MTHDDADRTPGPPDGAPAAITALVQAGVPGLTRGAHSWSRSLSASNLTPADPSGTERRACEEFARNHAAPEYRGLLTHAYAEWHESNVRLFDGRLLVPHIGVGQTHARRFSQCRLTTNYGGAIDITLSERVAFATAARIVRAPWPAPGLARFLDDLLLGETVKQSVLELLGSTEDGYGGYGPLFAAEAMRIGPMVGLPEIEILARRRAYRGRGEPVATSWPWGFRAEGYYLGDVNLSAVNVAGLSRRPRSAATVPPGVYDYLLCLAATNQIARLIDVLGRQADADLEARAPAVAAFERSPHDLTGRPVPAPAIDPDWLSWNAGCVRRMAESVLTRRLFDVMPILADALQDAGCDDPVLLDHCRANVTHTANCWALALLAAQPA